MDKDQDQEGPVVVAEAETDGVADAALIIPADPVPPGPASRATTRTASTPRPWTTAIAPRLAATAMARARVVALVPASPRPSRRLIPSLCPHCAKIPTRASLP